ncbi:hypothetical protein C1I72_00955 [Ehrlichia canis]|nr:hypothetical protein C1I72_00955 [Ehrlichia canis]
MGNSGISIIVCVVFIFLIMMVLVSMFQRNASIFDCVGRQQCKASNADHDKGNDTSNQSEEASVNTDLVSGSNGTCEDIDLQSVQSRKCCRT